MPLLKLIRAKLAEDKLPKAVSRQWWVVGVIGAKCDGCDLPISETGAQFEAVDGSRWHFHADCVAIWDRERTRELVAAKGN